MTGEKAQRSQSLENKARATVNQVSKDVEGVDEQETEGTRSKPCRVSIAIGREPRNQDADQRQQQVRHREPPERPVELSQVPGKTLDKDLARRDLDPRYTVKAESRVVELVPGGEGGAKGQPLVESVKQEERGEAESHPRHCAQAATAEAIEAPQDRRGEKGDGGRRPDQKRQAAKRARGHPKLLDDRASRGRELEE